MPYICTKNGNDYCAVMFSSEVYNAIEGELEYVNDNNSKNEESA